MGKSFLGGEQSAVIDRTPEEVFDYLADMSRRHEWNGETGFTVTRRPEAGLVRCSKWRGTGSGSRLKSLGQIRDTGYGQLQLKLA
jgi:uncharacterized protein YndB with AHSA1/START domain